MSANIIWDISSISLKSPIIIDWYDEKVEVSLKDINNIVIRLLDAAKEAWNEIDQFENKIKSWVWFIIWEWKTEKSFKAKLSSLKQLDNLWLIEYLEKENLPDSAIRFINNNIKTEREH